MIRPHEMILFKQDLKERQRDLCRQPNVCVRNFQRKRTLALATKPDRLSALTLSCAKITCNCICDIEDIHHCGE